MAKLSWDDIGDRIFQTGVDHGVLYLHDGSVAPWNGLTGVEDGSDQEIAAYYLDGVKYLEILSPGDYQGKLKAYTYPNIFESVSGITNVSTGLFYHDQPPQSFGLSYRTKIGNAMDGVDHGYKIHILYNLLAQPDSKSFATIDESGAHPIEFEWSLTGTPPKFLKFRPTVHISIDSTKTPKYILDLFEQQLYGTDTINPSLPSIQDIAELFGYLGALIIIDYGDGSWIAIDESDTYITMLDDTTFQIDDADATYLDADTYTISSTNVS